MYNYIHGGDASDNKILRENKIFLLK